MPTQYGSRLDTFLAPDIFAAILNTKAIPPVDLALAVADCRESFFFNRMGQFKLYGFATNERLILRRSGLWSNLGDGLVLNNANFEGGGPSLELNLTGWGARHGLLGIIGTAVVGVGTAFLQDFAVGMRIAYRANTTLLTIGTISAIANDTHATLSVATGDTTGNVAAYPELIPNNALPLKPDGTTITPPSGAGYTMGIAIPLIALNQLFSQEFLVGSPQLNVPAYTGTISVGAGSVAVTGTQTRFLAELAANMFLRWKDDAGVQTTRKILSVTDDTHLVLATVTASAATNQALIVGLNHLRLTGKVVNPLAFATITIDPQFATKYLNLGFVAEIEHTFDSLVITE
jgi:hypothetical protein